MVVAILTVETRQTSITKLPLLLTIAHLADLLANSRCHHIIIKKEETLIDEGSMRKTCY